MIVVKIGGGAGNAARPVLAELAERSRRGLPWVLVHGASARVDEVARRLGRPPRYVVSASGMPSRRTDHETALLFAMVAAGDVNSRLVAGLQALGVDAVGLSGLDGRLFAAARKKALRIVEDGRQRILRDDYTGTIRRVNVQLLRLLLAAGHAPVVGPPALGEEGEILNVDADRAAAALAAALGAECLLLLTGAAGLLRDPDDPASLVHCLDRDELLAAIGTHARGRMRVKLLAAGEALDGGVGRVVIAGSDAVSPVGAALAGAGTVIRAARPRPAPSAATGARTDGSLGAEERHGSGVYRPRGIALVRGAGATVWDEAGRAYLDCVAGHGAAILGHAHPALVGAVAAQVGRLAVCPGSFANDVRARLLARLAELSGFPRFFLATSGTEAVEGALKAARWKTGRSGIVAVRGGFHGRTLGALSATWEPRYREPFAPLVPGVSWVPLDDLPAAAAAISAETAAVVVEPVQGEGGVRPANPAYLAGLRELCDQRGALLVFDEVQTGFGRTGSLFAFLGCGVRPDLVALAKGIAGGLPLGAVALGRRVGTLPPGSHGSTFGGSPVACAAALATLDVLAGEELPRRAAELGARALDALRHGLAGVPVVREVRGRGLLLGVELRVRAAPLLRALAEEEGVLALPAGPTVIRLLPPLTIAVEELDRAVEAVVAVVRRGVGGGSRGPG